VLFSNDFKYLSLTCQFFYSVHEYGNFLNSDISQGSVATFVRCGEIFNADFVANLLMSLPVKEFWLAFGKVAGKSMTVPFFPDMV